ncbi:MAG: hypothetical protein CSA58_05055 [Micrococcales bacterium]|nr:MAG: hypothetical protein CSB46_06990 [Micrococcales bacterium]PIE27327.1 MAG: hypothetical protein CSA58_05055 [Micrococcales bacterium]
MAYVILGFLHISRMSLYDLIKAFESGVSLFYAASSGSIKRALDGLAEEGAIKAADGPPGPRGRKEYVITAAGRRKFLEWMTDDIKGDVETEALSRLYFLGFVDREDRALVLTAISQRLESELRRFKALEAKIASEDVPEQLQEVALYQRATLDYGLSSLNHALRWFEDQQTLHHM